MFALDISGTGANGRQEHIGELVEVARRAFNALPRAAHEAIAHGNIEKLLKGCAALR